MKVWNVHKGCQYEGGSTIGIFASYIDALDAVKNYVWVQNLSAHEGHHWEKNEQDDTWENHSDFIAIFESEIGALDILSRRRYIRADLVKLPITYKAHACNAKGKWGSGIAHAFRDAYPKSYAEYQAYCAQGNTLGTAFVTSEGVICLITSSTYSPPDSEEDILKNTSKALDHLARQLPNNANIFSNRFNSGLFGVEWYLTAELVDQFLKSNTQMTWVVCDLPTKDKNA